MSEPGRGSAPSAPGAFGSSTLGAALAGAWLIFAAIVTASGEGLAALVPVGNAAIAAGITLGTRSSRWADAIRAQALTLATLVGLFAVALLSGQSSSPVRWYLLLVGLLAAQMGGWRSLIGWSLAGVAALVALHASDGLVEAPTSLRLTAEETFLGGVGVIAASLAYAALARRAATAELTAQVARERTIAAQTAELREVRDQLENANREAVAASNAKSRLMARVSHELRTPLNGLIGLAEILSEAKLPTAQMEIVRTLRASAATLLQLVNDLLDITQLEEGKLPSNPEPTRLREVVGDVLDTFANVAERKGLTLVGIVEGQVPHQILVDGLRLRQIVSNLVNNALKFTDEGEVVVRVSGAAEGGTFRGAIDVVDTGHGIAEEKLDRLFVAFEQVEESVPLRRQGAGLGLWIAKQLAEAVGGALRVQSTPGEGSTFTLTLEAPLGEATRMRESGLAMIGLRVLAVVPHPLAREALLHMARFDGLALKPCAGLDELPEDEPPDVVIVDHAIGAAEARTRLREVYPQARLVLGTPASHTGPPPRGYTATTLTPYRSSRIRAVLFEVVPDPTEEGSKPPSDPPENALRVLVVDDDSTNRMVARLFLERAGHEVQLAATTQEAWTLLSEEQFDVAFVDLHLPDASGLSLASHVRAELDPDRRLTIIALTAATSEEDRQRCAEAGMDDFVAKPIQVGLFRAALERAQRTSTRRRRSSRSVPLVFDRATYDALAEALEEDIQPLVRDYIENGHNLLRELRTHLGGDRRSAHRAVHTLASGSAMLGARGTASLARAIEATLKRGEAVAPADVFALERAFVATAEQLGELAGKDR